MKLFTPYSIGFAAASAAVLFSSCASKQYVRDNVAPVQAQVDTVEQKSDENSDKIAKLDERVGSDVGRLDEKTDTALRDAADAMEAAKQAQTSAEDAAGMAGEAKTFAGTGLNRLERTMAEMSQYRKETTASVLFNFDSADLTDDGKKALDSMARRFAGKERYVLEVRGFTDSTGSDAYNMRLSERRADNVVRYLTVQHGVPLRAIHRLGLGKLETPEGANSREARKQNRRVDVSLYLPLAEPNARLSSN